MKIRTLIIGAGLLFSAACAKSQQANIQHVQAVEFNELIEKGSGQLIDIRTPGEYNSGHIKGAVMIDFYAPTYKNGIDKLDKSKPLYIYCRSGSRSSKSIKLLQELGFTEVVNLRYGIIDWQKSGYSLTN